VELLLLPSPLLGAAAYDPLRAALAGRGYECILAVTSRVTSASEVVAEWSAVADAGLPMLAHSNAGYLAPAVRAATGSDQRIVFMDAALPPDEGRTRPAPPGLRTRLADLADPGTGLLPPWTRWWPRAELLRTVPAHLFETLDADCPQLPLDYFDSSVEAPPGWVVGSNAYLAFADTYATELEFAQGHGWPTRRLSPAGHLHFLWDGASVADAVAELVSGET
jgi:hypothetical protein